MAKPTDKTVFADAEQREIWSEVFLVQSDTYSFVGMLKSQTSGPKALGIPGVNGPLKTWTIPTYSKLNKNVLPPTLRAMDNPSVIQGAATSGERLSFRKSTLVEAFDDSKAPDSLIQRSIDELSNWWAMFQDLYGVYELSAGRNAIVTTTEDTYTASFTSLTGFKIIANTAGVGQSTSEQALWFCDDTTPNGLKQTIPANTWNNLDETNILTPDAIKSLYPRLQTRGPRPALFNIGGVVQWGYLIVGSSFAYEMIINDTNWKDHVREVDVRGDANRYWDGENRTMLKIGHFLFMQVTHPLYSLDRDSPTRTEDIGNGDTFFKEELLVLGGQSFGYSEYDMANPVIAEQTFDGGFENYLILNMIFGMGKLQYVLNDATRRDSSASLCAVIRS